MQMVFNVSAIEKVMVQIKLQLPMIKVVCQKMILNVWLKKLNTEEEDNRLKENIAAKNNLELIFIA